METSESEKMKILIGLIALYEQESIPPITQPSKIGLRVNSRKNSFRVLLSYNKPPITVHTMHLSDDEYNDLTNKQNHRVKFLPVLCQITAQRELNVL